MRKCYVNATRADNITDLYNDAFGIICCLEGNSGLEKCEKCCLEKWENYFLDGYELMKKPPFTLTNPPTNPKRIGGKSIAPVTLWRSAGADYSNSSSRQSQTGFTL